MAHASPTSQMIEGAKVNKTNETWNDNDEPATLL